MRTRRQKLSIADRFWPKVRKGPNCWQWLGNQNGRGYGLLWVQGFHSAKLATHVAFCLQHGRWPRNGMVMAHHCDNPGCVRIDHLYEGTHKQNAMDSVERGRKPHGVQHHNAKLTPRSVSMARCLWRKFGNGRRGGKHQRSHLLPYAKHLGYLLQRKTWKHVA
jgi:hypothetical protein